MSRSLYRSIFPRLLILGGLFFSWLSTAPRAVAQPAPLQSGEQSYTVRPNDTIGSIASAYRVTLVSILMANPQIQSPNQLTAGQQIIIPPANLQPGQSIWSGYTGGSSAPRPTPVPPPSPPSVAPPAPPPNGAVQPIGLPGNWRLIFADEFGGDTYEIDYIRVWQQ